MNVARIRTIKPEFPHSESMGRVSRDARLCFVLLWTIADDSGRLRGSSRMLASLLFPYDDDAPNLIGSWLSDLEREGCIKRYEVEGSTYIEIAKWLSHQKIDKPSQSRFPAFDESSRILANLRECSSEDLGPGPRTGIKEGTKDQEGTGVRASPAGAVCLALKRAGISKVNPGHPRLLSLLSAGAEVSEFVGFAQRALESASGDPFPYILAAVEKERVRAKATAGTLHHGRLPNKQEALEQNNRRIAEDFIKKHLTGEKSA